MEASERNGKMLAIAAVMFIVFWSQCPGVSAGKNSTKMSYVCPPHFMRLGHSCYYFSDNKATWQNALFTCKDKNSSLSVPARWEDRNLRNYLNKPDQEKNSRWIGGIYDYASRQWKWGGELRSMHYQSFSKMQRKSPEELQWHCIAMMPELAYRWAPRSCIEFRQFICQTKLRKVSKAKLKSLRRQYERMGVLNEINAPSTSREVDSRIRNDVTVNPIANPKSFDLNTRPLPLRLMPKRHHMMRNNTTTYYVTKRDRPVKSRMTKPFRGYRWDRRDPEASYRYNEKILRSGKLKLTPQQVKIHLTRIQHHRDRDLNRQLARNKRLRSKADWVEQQNQPALAQSHARTYTIDNKISALHPKTIVEEFDMPPPPPPSPMVPIVRAHRAAIRPLAG